MSESAFRTLDVVSPSLQANSFFETYISKRQPVVVNGFPDDANFRATHWADAKLEYLAQKAGDVRVMVEPIHPSFNQFGTDVERVPMTFKDFLSSLQAPKGPYHYLTTQYAFDEDENEDEGEDNERHGTDVEKVTSLPPPTNALTDDFPLVPRLLGNLSLQQVNLWLGKSKEGSSSGLHHDFHDNLYILLSGSKRFVLYPPAEHVHLYPHGTLDKFHANGLISYKDAPVRSDGLPTRTAAQARVKAIEQKLETLAEVEKKSKGKGKGGRRKDHEKEKWLAMHDEALDELVAATLDDVADDGSEFGEGEDDFDALMMGLEGEAEDADDDVGLSSKRAIKEDSEDEDEDEAGPTLGNDEEEGDGSSVSASSEPSSFSRIPTHTLHTHLGLPTTALPPPSSPSSAFPDLQKTGKPFVVHLNAGEMLYLPASWWHEVTSTSSSTSRGTGTDVHMAFNYWFYPPTGDTFEQPYEDLLVWEYLKSQQDPSEGSQSDVKRKRNEDQDGGRKRVKQ